MGLELLSGPSQHGHCSSTFSFWSWLGLEFEGAR